MILLLDCGNSRVKWAIAELTGEFRLQGDLAYPGLAAALTELLAAWPQVSQAAVGSVSRQAQPALTELAQRLPVFEAYSEAEGGGITNAYPKPETLGVDRWLALLAARQRHQGELVVLDAGSAMTLDWLDARGQHQGGWIVPGIWPQANQWARQFGLSNWPPPTGPLRVGQDTASCLLTGVEALLIAWLRQSGEQFAGARWLLTGGDGARLSSYCDWPTDYYPLLVLEGLYWQWQRLESMRDADRG